MKDLAAEPVAETKGHRDLGHPRKTDPGATHELTPEQGPATGRAGAPSVLEHLRRGQLAAGWDQVVQEPGHELPGRADLERRFRTSLTQVRVHSGPGARSLLDHLGARAATHGQHIALRDRAVAAQTLVHEVVHTIQSVGDVAPTSVVDHRDPAEDEAEGIALGLRPARVHRTLCTGAVALRRTRQRHPDPASGALALGTEDLDEEFTTDPRPATAPEPGPRPAAEVVPERTSAPDLEDPSGPGSTEAEPPGREASEAGSDAPPDVDSRPAVQTQQDEAVRTTVEAAAEAHAPHRRAELESTLAQAQQEWDGGAATAEEHQVEPCPEHATRPSTRPFARGPPLEVPAVSTEPAPDPVDPDDVATLTLDRAQGSVQRQLDRAPARSPPVRTEGLDDEARAERQRAQGEVRRALDRAVGEAGVSPQADDRLELTGSADPERITTGHDAATAALSHQRDLGHQGTGEDFGETVMAPQSDPTTGLDTELDALVVPEISVGSMVDTTQLDAVATDANVGTVDIDSLVLATDEASAQSRERAAAISSARATIDRDIETGEVAAQDHCRRARAARSEVEGQVREGMAQRRGRWTAALDQHVQTRTAEADELVRTRRSHVEQVQTDTDDRAGTVLSEARTEAESAWQDGQQRAANKARESNDSSWFSRGIDWVRDAIRDLVSWIDSFIDALRSTLDALLDAAAAVAHAIVEAGHRAISATITGLQAALDVIVDNLPGELGQIANEYRADIHDFLDARQADVDGWAQDLHAGIDETIEDLRGSLHEALDEVQDRVHDVAAVLDDILANGFMPWLRRAFPTMAALIDEGLLAPVRRAGDMLGDWLSSALEATGITAAQAELEALHVESLCTPPTEQEQAEACAAFEARLRGAMETVDEILASPLAQRLQAFLQESRDDAARQQVDAASGFFDFIRAIALPVYEWWQSVEPTVEAVLSDLGMIASTIWRHIASALGIDPDLSPLEALRQGLEALWETVSAGVAPLVQAIRTAWDWLRNSSFLAPVFDFLAGLGGLATALGDLLGRMVEGSVAWLAEAAQVLSATVLPAVEQVSGALADLVLSAINTVAGWIDGIIGALDLVISFEAADALLDALAGLAGALVTPVKVALLAFKSCALRAWRWLANSLRDIVSFVRTLLDVAAGISLALLTFPVGVVTFLAGNVWLHVIPECYKAPLIDFLLAVAIRFLQFLPEPADFMWAMIYQGALNFLIGLQAAPREQKIGAVNLFASIFAGNAEVAAGFVVGLAEGVWEATGGTIIFLLQAVAWLMTLPFKLASWAAGMIRGALAPDVESGEPVGSGVVTRRHPRESRGGGLPRDGPSTGPDSEDSPSVIAAERRADAVADGVERRFAEAEEVSGDAEARAAHAADERQLDMLEQPGVRPVAPPGGIVAEEVGVDSDDDPLPVVADEPGGSQPLADENETVADTEAGEQPASATEAQAMPPTGPEGMSTLSAAFNRWISEGFSRDDVQQLIAGARDSLRGMIGTLAQQAARGLLSALNSQGAGFALGRAMGALVGMILVEVLLAVFTGGASAAVTATKAAISGARVTARFGSALAKVKRALEPLLGIVGRLKGALREVLGGIRRWFDEVLGWMRGISRRARGPRRTPAPPRRPGHRPGKSRRPVRHGGHRRRDRGRAGERRRRRAQARLRRAQVLLPPRIRRVVGRRGVPRRVVQARLPGWRRQFRLTRLWATDLGPRTRITARTNPTGPITALTDFEADESRELALHVRHETTRILESPEVTEGADRILRGAAHRAPTGAESAELVYQRYAGQSSKGAAGTRAGGGPGRGSRSRAGSGPGRGSRSRAGSGPGRGSRRRAGSGPRRTEERPGAYNIPETMGRHGVRSVDIPSGTTEAELAAVFRRMQPRGAAPGSQLVGRDPEGLVTVLNFGSTGGRTYLRQRPPEGRRHLENIILALMPRRKGGGMGAKSLHYGGRRNRPAEAATAVRHTMLRTASTDQYQALAAIMYGMEPTRSTAAFAHALFASDVDAFSRLNPGSPAAVSTDTLLGMRQGGYSTPGLAPFTGTGAPERMQLLDDYLAGTPLSPSAQNRARQQLAREAEMIRAWLRAQPDYLVLKFAARLDRMKEIKRRITIRLELAARR